MIEKQQMKKKFFLAPLLLFSMASGQVAPGGVSQNLEFWYKADQGFSGSQWNDASVNGIPLVQSQSHPTPVLSNTSAPQRNFNPSVGFSQASNYSILFRSQNVLPTPYVSGQTQGSFYAVARPKVIDGNWQTVWDMKNNGSNLTLDRKWTFWNNGYFNNAGNNNDPSLQPNVNTIQIATVHFTYKKPSSFEVNGYWANGNGSANGLGNGFYTVGNQNPNGNVEPWRGDISENFGYSKKLNGTDLEKVNTYLAIKYGITLKNNNGLYDYRRSDGEAIWNGTAVNSAYHNNVAGIGRDNASALHQKQANSVNDGQQVVISAGDFTTNDNAANGAAIPDLQFLTWGDNGQSRSYTTKITAPSGIIANTRMNAVWKVQRTSGFHQNVTVALPNSVPANTIYMVRSVDEVFDSADTWIPMSVTTVGGISYVRTPGTIDFSAGGEYFTFATAGASPGGVSENLEFWYKADQGFSGTQWNDASVNEIPLVQSQSHPTPVLSNTSAPQRNFNPSVGFSQASNYSILFRSQNVLPTPYVSGQTQGSFYAVARPKVIDGNWQTVWDMKNNGSNLTLDRKWTFWNNGYFNNAGNNNDPSLQPNVNTIQIATVHFTYKKPSSFEVNGYWANGNGSANGLGNGFYTVGNQNPNGNVEPWRGDISENFGYSKKLNGTDLEKVNTYLAVKYGITLKNNNGLYNYRRSDGEAIWNGTTVNSAYHNNVAGIGRDIASALHQKQANSVNDGQQVVISAGDFTTNDNAANGANIPDLQFLTWGDNGQSRSYTTKITAPSGIIASKRMSAIWKVQRTSGFHQNVIVALPNGVPANTIYMVRSVDEVFDSADMWIPMSVTTVGGISYVRTPGTIDFSAGGEYFTFAIADQSDYCTKDPATGTPAGFTKIGITGQSGIQNGWPGNVPNGFIALESKNKGMVITRTTSASIAVPVEGMLIYDTTDKCFKLYNGSAWKCITRSCND